MRRLILFATCLCAIVCATLANAGPTTDSIAYQGRLTDATDNAVPDGPRDLTISIWTDSLGGTMLYSQVGLVTISKGLFSTCVGCASSSFFDIFTDQPLFLQTQLGGQPAMVPRTRLRYAPRALVSSRVRGDISTSPGVVSLQDPSTGSYETLRNTPDSVDIELSFPDNGPLGQTLMKAKEKANRTKCGNNLRAISSSSTNEIDGTCDVTSAKHAINTKGAGGVSRSISSTTTNSTAAHIVEADVDGDGISDESISSKITPTVTQHAINTKGAGSGDRTISSTIYPDSMAQLLSSDADGNGKPEQEISSTITPTVTQHAINTKGAGSGDRSISSTTTNLSAVHSLEADVDGDGIADASIESNVAASSAKHAINTKGAGANDRSIVSATNDTSAAVMLACDDATISMKVVNSGAVKGNISVMQAGRTMVGLGSDGSGYFDHGIGVGMDATHSIDVSGGAYCDGANWVNASDANLKENFQPVDGELLLDQIDQLPVSEWNYKFQGDSVRHIGPTAQDFKEAFGVGSDGKSISTIDPSGIALVAIKELSRQNRELKTENESLKKRLDALSEKIDSLTSPK